MKMGISLFYSPRAPFYSCTNTLKGKPWTEQQLSDAYCATPQAVCSAGVPSTLISSALYICLCDGTNQAIGNHLELLCGCDVCLNIGPDFRGRCQTPCSSGQCSSGGSGGGAGGGGVVGPVDSSNGGKRDGGSHRHGWWM